MAKFGASDSPAPAHLVGFRSRRRATAMPAWQQGCNVELEIPPRRDTKLLES
jgi:hypothetical protein